MRQNRCIGLETEGSLLWECMKKKVSMACYRLPFSTQIHFIIQTQPNPYKVSTYEDLNYASGFIACPFDIFSQFQAYLIKPDLYFTDSSCSTEKIAKALKVLQDDAEFCSSEGKKEISTSKDEFIEQIRKVQSFVNTNFVQKVVLSRISIESRNHDRPLDEIFNDLCTLYPEAFVYFFKIPELGCWMGATPEPFLVLNDEFGIIESIAGTQLIKDQIADNMVWGKKEIEEQEIVTRFIEQNLQELEISSFRKEGPVTTQAGRLAHLRTKFIFSKQQIQRQIGRFIATFHPTPSVGGYPRKEALELIGSIEKHHREFYTGLVGPLNVDNHTAVYTNIRCMQIFDDAFWLYLGAGITKDSIPELEWEETNLKKTTILAALKQS
ncbi:MAG: chorismate-binding protein [Bacteroidales bacterium]|nr:chorismate-binding protein [Bacteroidales bacterium]